MSLIPAAIKIGSAGDRMVRVDFRLQGETEPLVFVGPAPCARTIGEFFQLQQDKRVRTIGAVLIRQADLVEGKHLRLVGDG